MRRVVVEMEMSPARVALAWLAGRPSVSSILMGASRPAQVADNFGALDVVLSPQQRAALDRASAPAEPRMLYAMSRAPMRQHVIYGGSVVRSPEELARP